MRGALELLYKGSGFLAGFFLVAIAVLSAAQIAARELGFAAYSYDDFAGFCLAASSFLGLAYTFRENEHIRMTLLLHHARGGTRRALELVSLAVAAFLVGYFGWYACDMTMTLGLVTLFVAMTDDLVAALRGRTTSYDAARARKTEAMPGFER